MTEDTPTPAQAVMLRAYQAQAVTAEKAREAWTLAHCMADENGGWGTDREIRRAFTLAHTAQAQANDAREAADLAVRTYLESMREAIATVPY